MELYVIAHLQVIVKAAPDVVPKRLGLLCELKNPHAGVDLALLANGEPVDVDPRAIGTVERSSDRCQIARVT